MLRSLVAALALLVLPALASAQLPQHNEEVTVTDTDPTGQCSDGRAWTNTATDERFHCYGKAWHSAGAGAGLAFPLGAGDGCAVPPYAFTSSPMMGLCKGLAATWGFDSLVLQTTPFTDFEASFLQLSETSGLFAFLGASDASFNGGTVYAQAPIGGLPWSNVVLNATELTTGTGANANFEVNAAATGIGFGRITINSDASLESITEFLADETTFTDPVRVPAGTAAAPAITSLTDPTTGFYFAADERIDFATNGINRFILSEAGPSVNATFSLFGGTVNTFAANVSDPGGSSGKIIVTSQTTTSSVELSSTRSGDAGRTGFFSQSNGPRQARLDVNATTKLSALDDRVHILFPLDLMDPVGSKPTCDSSKRGWFWKTDGAAGDGGTLEVCMKDSGDAYAWMLAVDQTAYGELRFSTPAGTTTTSGTPIKALGTTTLGAAAFFDMPANNRLRYIGDATKVFSCGIDVSLTSTSNNFVASILLSDTGTVDMDSEIQRFIGTGSDVGAASTHGLLTFAENDYLELFLDSAAGNPQVTVELATMTCTEV